MGKIIPILNRDEKTINQLLIIWESAVRETHTFLSENDIIAIRPEVIQGLQAIEYLYCYSNDNGNLQGFIGVAEEKIEMLFIDAGVRGQGIGKQLLNYALDYLNIKYVDVNEQNELGVGFYSHMGFHIMNRSEFDEQGRPFPILHLGIASVSNTL